MEGRTRSFPMTMRNQIKKYEDDGEAFPPLIIIIFYIHSHRFSTFIQNRISLLRDGNFFILYIFVSFPSATKSRDFSISSFATTYFTLLLHSRRVMKNIFERSFSSFFLSLKWFSFNFIRFCSILAIALSSIMKSEVKWKWFSSIQKMNGKRRRKFLLFSRSNITFHLRISFHYVLSTDLPLNTLHSMRYC